MDCLFHARARVHIKECVKFIKRDTSSLLWSGPQWVFDNQKPAAEWSIVFFVHACIVLDAARERRFFYFTLYIILPGAWVLYNLLSRAVWGSFTGYVKHGRHLKLIKRALFCVGRKFTRPRHSSDNWRRIITRPHYTLEKCRFGCHRGKTIPCGAAPR